MIPKNTKKLIKTITDRLVATYQPKRVILFGSYAYGTPTENSDIDIMIVVEDSPVPQYKRSRKGYSQLRDINVPVELLVMTENEIARSKNIITSLAYKAIHKGEVLYG